MSRTRRTFSQETVELVTNLWNTGKSIPEICDAAGISRDTLDFHRAKGAFQHLQRRARGGINCGKRLPDDENKKVLFGMKQHEWEQRKLDVQNKWTPHEEFHRRTGQRIEETRATEYNPGQDVNRSHHPLHARAGGQLNRADQYFKNSGMS